MTPSFDSLIYTPSCYNIHPLIRELCSFMSMAAGCIVSNTAAIDGFSLKELWHPVLPICIVNDNDDGDQLS